MSITSTTTLGDAPSGVHVPADPYKFGKAVEYSQPNRYKYPYQKECKVLFNKGRYFETSIMWDDTLKALCDLTGFKPQHTNMIVESWDKMEDFVIAMNILGIYVEIDIDWI